MQLYSRRTVILTHAYFDITVILTQQQRTLPSLIAGFPASPEEGEEAAQPHKPPSTTMTMTMTLPYTILTQYSETN